MALRQATRYRQYRGHKRITAPAVEPITVQDVREQLRLDEDASEDAYIELLIGAAREQCEEVTGRALITQSWKMTLDQWPGFQEPWWDGVMQGAISELRSSARPFWVMLPRYRLQSVDEVRIFDQAGNPDTVDLSLFIVDTEQEPGRLVLRSTATWPIALQSTNAVEIDYTAGYGDNPEDVPAALRLALMQMVSTMYEYRGDDCTAENAMKQSGAGTIFNRFKVYEL